MQPSILWNSHRKMAIIHSLMCIVPFSFVLLLAVSRCNSLSFFVTPCHSLWFVIPLFVICYHSLLFVVTRCTTRCHSLLLVATRCTTRLSFYKRSIQSMKFAITYFLKIAVHKCKRENFSKTFEAVHIWWSCLAKLRANNLQSY